MRLLLVEDEEKTSTYLSRVLGESGFTIDISANGVTHHGLGLSTVVNCPPGVRHWHGAAPDSAMTHLAITGIVDGKSVKWMEKVTDEQYHAH